MLSEHELFDHLREMRVLLDRLRTEKGIHGGRQGNKSDIDYVESAMEVENLFEFSLILFSMLGPVLLPSPILCFDSRLGTTNPYYFKKVLDNYPEWVRMGWLPVATDKYGGYFIYPAHGDVSDPRPIFRVRPDLSSVDPYKFVASNILSFLMRLMDFALTGKDGDPFREDVIAKTDPSMKREVGEYKTLAEQRHQSK